MTFLEYLAIPDDYAREAAGLEWSPTTDALIGYGGTVAPVEQVELVLEGLFAATDRIPHFPHVAHLMWLIIRRPATMAVKPIGPLMMLPPADANPAYSRNLGALIAELCRPLPAVASPPCLHELADVVKLMARSRVLMMVAERPTMSAGAFQQWAAERFSRYSIATFTHWLRHGGPPAADAGQKLAEQLPPPTPLDLLAQLRDHPRLAGAAALAPAFDAALSLPPRKLAPDRLPQGGYSGVTNRGIPDRLLPSQFALDPLDFVRRFAENELLYYRREEPRTAERPERVVLLDQGVRTWGGVRIALAAAVAALAGRDPKKAGPLRVVTTAGDGSDLAARLAACDFGPHPGPLLAATLAEPAAGPRDFLLLTHPRALAEPAVTDAARTVAATDRLFALTVDDRGAAELLERRPGGFHRLRAFRVDLDRALRAEAAPARRPPAKTAAWTGDVEAVSYPFRPGLLAVPERFAFDHEGTHLLIGGAEGLLQCLSLADGTAEVLPRPSLGARPMIATGMVGVTGGFVVSGRVDDPYTRPEACVAHYDLDRRTVRVHKLPDVMQTPRMLVYHADLHCITVSVPRVALDLETHGRHPPLQRDGNELTARARAAYERVGLHRLPPPDATVIPSGASSLQFLGPWVRLSDGTIAVGNVQPQWTPFRPTRDGGPLFPNSASGVAQLAGDVLALKLTTDPLTIHLFRGPDGRALGQRTMMYAEAPFRLSPDGRWLADECKRRTVEVTSTADPDRSPIRLTWAATHGNLKVECRGQPTELLIAVGNHYHWLNLEAVPFRPLAGTHDAGTQLKIAFTGRHVVYAGASVEPPVTPAFVGDTNRFRVVPSDWMGGTVVTDRWGQVIVCDRKGNIVAYVLVRRELIAVALPDGTRWGSPALLGCGPTPNAEQRIGEAFRKAFGGSP